MKVLMVSMDRKILEEGSEANARTREYGELFDELRVVVFRKSHFGFGAKDVRISERVSARSMSRIRALFWNPPSADVVTAQDPFETGFIARRLAKKLGAPLHVQIHTDFMSSYFKRGILNRARVFLSKRNLQKAKAIRAVSERIKRSLPVAAREKTSVLSIFADVEAIGRTPLPVGFKSERFKFKKNVIVASRLTSEKDIATAVEAFSKVVPTHEDAGLAIIGEGPEKPSLEAKARSLGLEGRISFLPWMDKETLALYMKTSDAFLSTSLFEGYGLSMLEAHAAGATLVATDAGMAPELTSFVCAPRDAECLASKLSLALSGQSGNKAYAYPYASKEAYLEAFRADIERAIS